MSTRLICGIALALIAPLAHAQKGEPFDAAAAFGARESVMNMSLSPDGEHVAYVAPGPGQGLALFTLSLEKGAHPRQAAFVDGKPDRLGDCTWVANDRLACRIYGVARNALAGLLRWSRMVSLDADGKNLRLLSTQENPYSRGWALGGGAILDYNTLTDEGFSPRAVDRDLNVVYGLKKKDGLKALYSISLDGSLQEEMLYSRPDVDVDTVIRLGRRQRVVGVSYVTDTRHVVYLSPDVKQLLESLGRALPGSAVRVVDNFRGSTGYGDAWFEENGFHSWPVAIGDVLAAGRWLVSQGIADPAKLGIFGWSYGGYAALQSAVVDPNVFKAVIAVAPVTDLPALKEEFRKYTSYAMMSQMVGDGPQTHEGSPVEHADKIKVPVLLFHGAEDTNVNIAESEHMAARLKAAGGRVELVTWSNLDHYLDDSAARTQMLKKSDEFLRQAFGLEVR